jgi:hypothetical protein
MLHEPVVAREIHQVFFTEDHIQHHVLVPLHSFSGDNDERCAVGADVRARENISLLMRKRTRAGEKRGLIERRRPVIGDNQRDLLPQVFIASTYLYMKVWGI